MAVWLKFGVWKYISISRFVFLTLRSLKTAQGFSLNFPHSALEVLTICHNWFPREGSAGSLRCFIVFVFLCLAYALFALEDRLTLQSTT